LPVSPATWEVEVGDLWFEAILSKEQDPISINKPCVTTAVHNYNPNSMISIGEDCGPGYPGQKQFLCEK
jgi:hypothetical protein